jgi:MSHA pilin protein MshC
MATRRALSGFSLAELITTIVIIAILAAFALPKLNQQATETVYFSEQVKSAVRYAQKQAIAQRRNVYVVVS